MTIRNEKSFCRICAGGCGVEVTIENDRPIEVRGDRDQPMTKGYICFKGVHAALAHTSRFVKSLGRRLAELKRSLPHNDAVCLCTNETVSHFFAAT